MSWISGSENGPKLSAQQQRLCAHNIEACKAYRAGLVKLPPLEYQPLPRDYEARPLATPLPIAPTKRKRYRGPSELKRRAERSAAHKQKPVEQPLVTMVAIAPPPPSSLLPA